MGFPRQEYCSKLPFPTPGDLPDLGVEPVSPALGGRFFTTEPPGSPKVRLPGSNPNFPLQGWVLERLGCPSETQFLRPLRVFEDLIIIFVKLLDQSLTLSGLNKLAILVVFSVYVCVQSPLSCPHPNPAHEILDFQLCKFQFSSVAQLCPTLCDPMNHSTPGLPIHHQLLEFTQTHIHWVRDAIQSSHPLSFPSPLAPNPSQHQSLFEWVNSSHEVAKVLELQL